MRFGEYFRDMLPFVAVGVLGSGGITYMMVMYAWKRFSAQAFQPDAWNISRMVMP